MLKLHASRKNHFVFISSNRGWGGSEELWSSTAAELAVQGHRVTVFKPLLESTNPRIQRLRALGCTTYDLTRIPLVPRKLYSAFAYLSYPLALLLQMICLFIGLFFTRADLIVISQGGNGDGLPFADICRRMKRPYVVIAQKAADIYWPLDRIRARLRAVYAEALVCYFVSEHNQRLTEEQIGLALPHGTVVRNPFLVSWEPRNDWPAESDAIRLACIGRLYPMEKGQDVLLRVLARDKWRRRPLSVTFYGKGPQNEALKEMAELHGLTSVRFGGFVDDVPSIWNDHHGLVLPSRCEGLPLVLVEAMLSGRVSIVTDVAGAREMLDDGESGFLATVASEDALDEAMERAWQRRDEWRAIGAVAAERIRTRVPSEPAAALAEQLLGVATRAERDVRAVAPIGSADADTRVTT